MKSVASCAPAPLPHLSDTENLAQTESMGQNLTLIKVLLARRQRMCGNIHPFHFTSFSNATCL